MDIDPQKPWLELRNFNNKMYCSNFETEGINITPHVQCVSCSEELEVCSEVCILSDL